MRRLLIVAAAVAVLAAGGAFAGEVKGPSQTNNTNETAAPDHANSICAFSGLNDLIVGEGQLANRVQTAADSFKIYGNPKGTIDDACYGGSW